MKRRNARNSSSESFKKMKRKKWSEIEELTLLTKYSQLHNSGALSKLKTREKKFKPVADHVNSVHHLRDPTTFPFKWSWRDVSIKVQNMRYQYLGVKQKIRISNNQFSWNDGENHWVNFLKYKDVFGDVELESIKEKRFDRDVGFGDENEDYDDDDEYGGRSNGDGGTEREFEDMGFVRGGKLNKGFGLGRLGVVNEQVLELRDVMVGREEMRIEKEFRIEKDAVEIANGKRELESSKEERLAERDEELERREMELEERHLVWARRECEKRRRLEEEYDNERRRRMVMEEKKEEEEMEWRERMINLQMDHEKAMVQMHSDACQNQMQLIGIMARFVCQFFGSGNDGLSNGLGASPSQILHDLQHPGGLGDSGKPDTNSPSQFI